MLSCVMLNIEVTLKSFLSLRRYLWGQVIIILRDTNSSAATDTEYVILIYSFNTENAWAFLSGPQAQSQLIYLIWQ